MIALMMLAAAVTTCPGGPIFAFQPGSARFSEETTHALPTHVGNLNSDLWREGWITVSPTVLNVTDEKARKLVRRREQAIREQMSALGIARSRVRFEAVNVSYGAEPKEWVDVYPSTLSVSGAVWKRTVAPGVVC